MKRSRWLMLLAVASLVAGCGSSSKTSSTSNTVGGKLTIVNESGSTWTCQFNPFNPAVTLTSFGFVYEPLQYVNILQSKNPPVPMLATESKWSNGFKTLTFTIRKGAKWSDGTELTAADVAYT